MALIEDVAKGFCGNKEIRSKYGDLVESICKTLFDDVCIALFARMCTMLCRNVQLNSVWFNHVTFTQCVFIFHSPISIALYWPSKCSHVAV